MSKAKTPAKTETQTPTANGVIKGRPGKGRVLSLGQRKHCYAQHAMTPDNTFRYTAKRVKGQPKPVEREWCKKCRATSRKASATARRLREAKEEKSRQIEAKAQLTQALPKAKAGKRAYPSVAEQLAPAKAKATGKAKAKATGKAKAKATGKAKTARARQRAYARNSQADAA